MIAALRMPLRFQSWTILEVTLEHPCTCLWRRTCLLGRSGEQGSATRFCRSDRHDGWAGCSSGEYGGARALSLKNSAKRWKPFLVLNSQFRSSRPRPSLRKANSSTFTESISSMKQPFGYMMNEMMEAPPSLMKWRSESDGFHHHHGNLRSKAWTG